MCCRLDWIPRQTRLDLASEATNPDHHTNSDSWTHYNEIHFRFDSSDQNKQQSSTRGHNHRLAETRHGCQASLDGIFHVSGDGSRVDGEGM